jgi:hypothetical protein
VRRQTAGRSEKTACLRKRAKTPFQRILEQPDPDVPLLYKQRLIEQNESLNIITLQKQLDTALEKLDRFVHRVPGTVVSPESHG